MKYFFSDIWQSIRNRPLFSLLLFLQLTVTCIILHMSIGEMLVISEKANTAKINWGDNDYASITPDRGKLGDSVYTEFFSARNPQFYTDSEEEYLEYIELYKNFEKFYNEVSQIDGLTIIVRCPTYHTLITDPADVEGKEIDDDINILTANLEYVNGNMIPQFNSYFVGKDHLEFYDIKLSEGRYFSEESYTSYENGTEILLGSDFKGTYNIGDELYFAYMVGPSVIFKLTKATVCGFIEKDQYFTSIGKGSTILCYNDAALIPYLDASLDEYLENFDSLLGIFPKRIYGASYIFEGGTYDTIQPQILQIAEKYGLSDYIKITKSKVERVLSSNYQDRYNVSLSFMIISVVLSVLSVVFIMLYSIENEVKQNAIRMLVGQTQGQIILRSVFTTAIYFIVTWFVATNLYVIYETLYLGGSGLNYTSENNKYLFTGIIMLGMFIISTIAVCISIKIKFRTLSVSMLIRGNDVKQTGKFAIYRLMLAITFIFQSIFIMFIAGFAISLEKIDMYYLGYNSEYVRAANVSFDDASTAPNISIKFKQLGDDILINKYISMEYVGTDYIVVRAIYLNGDAPRLDMQKGRFFTDEEMLSDKKLAVVGPEIYEKYVTVGEDGKEYFTCDNLSATFEVIGVFGKEGSVSNMDLHVFVPMGFATKNFSVAGSYTLDAKSEDLLPALEANFTAQLEDKANVYIYLKPPTVTVSTTVYTMILMFILTVINSIVFSSYYLLKQKHILSVKKFLGYSKKLILADTFLYFLVLVVISFVVGNLTMSVLSQTVLSQIELFDLYVLDIRALGLSLIGTAILALIFSIIAVNQTYSKDTSQLLRNG